MQNRLKQETQWCRKNFYYANKNYAKDFTRWIIIIVEICLPLRLTLSSIIHMCLYGSRWSLYCNGDVLSFYFGLDVLMVDFVTFYYYFCWKYCLHSFKSILLFLWQFFSELRCMLLVHYCWIYSEDQKREIIVLNLLYDSGST